MGKALDDIVEANTPGGIVEYEIKKMSTFNPLNATPHRWQPLIQHSFCMASLMAFLINFLKGFPRNLFDQMPHGNAIYYLNKHIFQAYKLLDIVWQWFDVHRRHTANKPL